MARNVSLLDIRTEIVDQGGYKNSPVFTIPVLNRWINRAIARVYDFVWRSGDDYYTEEATLATVAGNDAVALPATFLKLLSLGRQDGDDFRRLRRMVLHDWAKWEGLTGEPTHYRIQKSNLKLCPKPDAIYSVRLYYLPVAPTLTLDADTFDSIDYFDELVIAYVLKKCAGRDERQLAEIQQEIQLLEHSIKGRAEARDAGEPIYLADLDEGEDDF